MHMPQTYVLSSADRQQVVYKNDHNTLPLHSSDYGPKPLNYQCRRLINIHLLKGQKTRILNLILSQSGKGGHSSGTYITETRSGVCSLSDAGPIYRFDLLDCKLGC